MPRYTIAVDALFQFDVDAPTADEAKAKARELLKGYEPVDQHGALASVFQAPWVSVGGADTNYLGLEAVDEWDTGDDQIAAAAVTS